MGTLSHCIHAEDDSFLRALGLDPTIYPKRYTWDQFCEERGLDAEDLINDVIGQSGFFRTVRLRSLKERLELYGYEVLADFYEVDTFAMDGPRVVIAATDIILKEKASFDLEEEYHCKSEIDDRSYYFDVERLVGRLHLSFWCNKCLKSFDVKTDLPAYNGTECVWCKSYDTKLIAVDEVKQ